MSEETQVFTLEGGDVRVWIEQAAIHLRAGSPHKGDPAELTSSSARKLAQQLLKMADEISD